MQARFWVMFKDIKAKLDKFIEERKGILIALASILLLIGFVGAMLYAYCCGVAQMVGLVVGLTCLVISTIIFLVLGIRYDRRVKREARENAPNPPPNPPPNLPAKIRHSRKKPSRLAIIALCVMTFFCFLLFAGVLMVIFGAGAVRVTGIVFMVLGMIVVFTIGSFLY